MLRRSAEKLRRWEMALVLSVCISLAQGLTCGAMSGASWWGVVFPGLTADCVETEASNLSGGVEIRFRFLDWLSEILDCEHAETV